MAVMMVTAADDDDEDDFGIESLFGIVWTLTTAEATLKGVVHGRTSTVGEAGTGTAMVMKWMDSADLKLINQSIELWMLDRELCSVVGSASKHLQASSAAVCRRSRRCDGHVVVVAMMSALLLGSYATSGLSHQIAAKAI